LSRLVGDRVAQGVAVLVHTDFLKHLLVLRRDDLRSQTGDLRLELAMLERQTRFLPIDLSLQCVTAAFELSDTKDTQPLLLGPQLLDLGSEVSRSLARAEKGNPCRRGFPGIDCARVGQRCSFDSTRSWPRESLALGATSSDHACITQRF
jgi:hypothetical protein